MCYSICAELLSRQRRSSTSFLLAVVAVGVFTNTLLATIIAPSLPAVLIQRIHVPPDEVSTKAATVLSTFGLSLLISSLFLAPLIQFMKRLSALFTFGLLLSVLSTVLWFQAKSYAALIIAIPFQGISGTIIWTSGMAMIHDRVPSRETGAATGIISGATAGAELVGFVSGGLLFDSFGEHGTFVLLMCVTGFGGLFRLLLVEPEEDEVTAAEASKLLSSESGPSNHEVCEGTEDTKVSMRKSLPSALFLNRQFMPALFIGMSAAATKAALVTALPLYLGQHFGWSSAQVGVAMFTLLFPTVGSAWYGGLKDRKGVFVPCSISLFAMSITLAALSGMSPFTATTSVLLFAALLLLGTFMLMASVVITSSFPDIMQSISCDGAASRGIVYAAMRFAFAAGVFIGPLSAVSADSLSGWRLMCLGLSGASVISLVLVFFGWFRSKSQSQGNAEPTEAGPSFDSED